MRSLGLLAVVTLLGLGGCDFYFNGGDDDCVVASTDIVGPTELRNPETGLCEPWGSGDYPCDSSCGPCPVAEVAPQPDWGECERGCEGLIESVCIQQAGCRAIYDANSTVDEPPQYMDCWAIAPSGPAPGGCENLDAYECSRHDNCSAYYDTSEAADPSLHFSSCRAEKSAASCESLASEAECTGRSDCRGVYNGEDCTCDANGSCVCQVLTYEHCETK